MKTVGIRTEQRPWRMSHLSSSEGGKLIAQVLQSLPSPPEQESREMENCDQKGRTCPRWWYRERVALLVVAMAWWLYQREATRRPLTLSPGCVLGPRSTRMDLWTGRWTPRIQFPLGSVRQRARELCSPPRSAIFSLHPLLSAAAPGPPSLFRDVCADKTPSVSVASSQDTVTS